MTNARLGLHFHFEKNQTTQSSLVVRINALVAELVYALAWGASLFIGLQVRVLSGALFKIMETTNDRIKKLFDNFLNELADMELIEEINEVEEIEDLTSEIEE